MLRAAAQDMYFRDLSMERRIRFVHDYFLAKIWCVTQTFPPPPDCIRQINTTISWFIWRGEIFRVPLSTLQRGKTEGGGTWLIHGPGVGRYSCTAYKCRASEPDSSLLDGWGFGT